MTATPKDAITEPVEVPLPDVSHLVTEDDTPVDNFFSAKQQELLTSILEISWEGRVPGEPFVVAANVGLYYSVNEPALVPDVMLSVDVRLPDDIWEKRHRTYLVWEFGKAPDLVIEIVSNRIGGEVEAKMARYARASVPYYAVYDPLQQVQEEKLLVHCLHLPTRTYEPCDPDLLPGIGLGLTLWRGEYAGRQDLWLRWLDADGKLIPTGKAALVEEQERANQERQRSRMLANKLRELGVDPDSIQ